MAGRISKAINREVVFYENADPNVKNDDGYYNNRDGKIYINAKSKNSVAHIIAHEMTHSVELADSYIDLFRTVIRRIQKTGGSISNMRNELKGRYARNGVQLSKTAQVDAEIMAEYIAKHLFTDEASITSLAAENRKGASAILRFLDNLLAKLGNTNARERIFIERARNIYVRALSETANAERAAEDNGKETRSDMKNNPADTARKGKSHPEKTAESESHEKTKTESQKPETEGEERDVESTLRQTLRLEIAENTELMQMLNDKFGASGMAALARQIEEEVRKTGAVGKFGMLFSDGGRAVEEALGVGEKQFSISKDASEENESKNLQNATEDDKIKTVGKTQDKSDASKNVEIVRVGNGVTLSYTTVDSAQWTDEMRAVEEEGKEFGCKTFFTDGEMEKRNAEGELERTIRDGTCVGDSIYINKNTEYPFEMIGRHELLHLLKRRNAEPYRALREKAIYTFYPQLFQLVIEEYASLTSRHYGESGENPEVAIEEILANLSYDMYTDNLPEYVADAEEARKVFDDFFDSYKNKELSLDSRGENKNGVKSEGNRFDGRYIDASRGGHGVVQSIPRNEGAFGKIGEVWDYGTEADVRGSQKENSGNRSEKSGDEKQYAITKDGEETGDTEAESEVPAYSLDFWDEWLEKIREYGAMEKGEKPTRELEVPKKVADDKPVSQTVRTVLEAKVTPDEALPTLEQMVLDGDFSYTVHTDKQAIKNAN